MRAPVVATGDGPEALLASRIPLRRARDSQKMTEKKSRAISESSAPLLAMSICLNNDAPSWQRMNPQI